MTILDHGLGTIVARLQAIADMKQVHHRRSWHMAASQLHDTGAILRKVHRGLTYVLTFGIGWLSGLLLCASLLNGWW